MAFNVLIVDDSSSMRAIIKKIIKVSGFDVGEFLDASDGKEALKVLADEWVDIVLTDINMPNVNGMELMAEMKKDELLRSIPIVMITTQGSEKKMQEAIDLGASGYVKKPFLPEDIKKTLSSIMGEEDGQRDNDGDDETGDFYRNSC
jgi:two-component system chemotaxis response regulator CheY